MRRPKFCCYRSTPLAILFATGVAAAVGVLLALLQQTEPSSDTSWWFIARHYPASACRPGARRSGFPQAWGVVHGALYFVTGALALLLLARQRQRERVTGDLISGRPALSLAVALTSSPPRSSAPSVSSSSSCRWPPGAHSPASWQRRASVSGTSYPNDSGSAPWHAGGAPDRTCSLVRPGCGAVVVFGIPLRLGPGQQRLWVTGLGAAVKGEYHRLQPVDCDVRKNAAHIRRLWRWIPSRHRLAIVGCAIAATFVPLNGATATVAATPDQVGMGAPRPPGHGGREHVKKAHGPRAGMGRVGRRAELRASLGIPPPGPSSPIPVESTHSVLLRA